ncbi:hypothetical protein CPB85DRAFT_794987 [Mucidula mucida]|nr:hypothetical protein CPB85DRAFT_794987 [Mucidula mucida]
MPPVIPIPADIAELTGPLIIGHLFNWGLLGALCIQAYIYYLAFPHDPIWPTKVLSSCVFILEVAQTCLNTRDAFRNFGAFWGDMLNLDDIGTYWLGVPVMAGIVSGIVQFFYAWRIWVLTKRYWIPSVIVVLSLTQSVSAFVAGNAARQINHFSELQAETYVVTSVWLAGTALCDTVIAMSMTWTLLRARTGVNTTDAVVFRIVRLSIETGTLCAIFAVLDLIFYVVFMHNNFHLVPSIALTKMYSNSFFAVLNSRVKIRDGRLGQTFSTDPTVCTCSASAPPLASVRFRSIGGIYPSESGPGVHDVELTQMTSGSVRDGLESPDDPKRRLPIGNETSDSF